MKPRLDRYVYLQYVNLFIKVITHGETNTRAPYYERNQGTLFSKAMGKLDLFRSLHLGTNYRTMKVKNKGAGYGQIMIVLLLIHFKIYYTV